MWRGEKKKDMLPYHPFSFRNYICKSHREEFGGSAREREQASCDPGHNPSAPACTSEEQEPGHKGGIHVNPLLRDQCMHVNGALFLQTAALGSAFVHAEAVMSESAVIRQH